MEIPMHPDECSHGNTHIEGVNECPHCRCDKLVRENRRLADENDVMRSECARLRAVATRIEGERHTAASALIESDLAHGEECVRLKRDLDIVTAARNALADIADDLNGDNGDDEELLRRRAEIASLRCLERTTEGSPQ